MYHYMYRGSTNVTQVKKGNSVTVVSTSKFFKRLTRILSIGRVRHTL